MKTSFNGTRELEQGDIITIGRYRYYCDSLPDAFACSLCSFEHIDCAKMQLREKIDCVPGKVYLTSVNNIIKREKKKIKESQKLIDKLSK